MYSTVNYWQVWPNKFINLSKILVDLTTMKDDFSGKFRSWWGTWRSGTRLRPSSPCAIWSTSTWRRTTASWQSWMLEDWRSFINCVYKLTGCPWFHSIWFYKAWKNQIEICYTPELLSDDQKWLKNQLAVTSCFHG